MSSIPSSPASIPGTAPTASSTDTIVLGGGCFWCTEAVFDRVQGVVDVESGYSNGQVARPTYEQVCTGRTGTVEVVKVAFDPSVISLRELLEIFFVIHDPTTLNRQGNDVGTQYRSGIYTTRDGQREVAQDVIREIAASGTYRAPIVTEVVPLADYSTAEAYHQDYFLQHPNQGYCAFVVGPKVEKFQKTFAARVKG
ncbi:MAG: peptide-methionine (S)-S-oxide reductase [Variovorax sp.]|nr:MAG: peptide-methionine (S)-S-oxide reductase [Variovorax sp.]